MCRSGLVSEVMGTVTDGVETSNLTNLSALAVWPEVTAFIIVGKLVISQLTEGILNKMITE